MADQAALAEIEKRIQVVEDNLRQLVEQAAAYSGAADEERNADRIADQQAKLDELLKQREVLLAGDAVYFLDTLEHERRGMFLDDEHTWRRSLREVQLYRRENPDAVIIPSHDNELFERLEPSYS